MKIMNISTVIKAASLAAILFSLPIQAESACWSAGILDGVCYQQSEHNTVANKKIESETKYSNSKCWTAGVLNGMCYAEQNSITTADASSQEATIYSLRCWTSGVLNGMCF
ncbi:MAG: hypothetical protein V3U71_04345 [Cocleimonas sp.]